MRHKYVRHSKIGFVIFPDMTELWHKDVAELVMKKERGHILSAGFVNFSNTGVYCHGKSESLGISFLPEDSQMLAKQLGI